MTASSQSNAPHGSVDGNDACPWKMRALFNEGLKYCVDRSIRFGLTVLPPRQPNFAYNQERDTLSVLMEYRNPQGIIMARTHQYVRGRRRMASGHGDPVLLRENGRLVQRRHRDDEECVDCPTWRPRAAQSAQELPRR